MTEVLVEVESAIEEIKVFLPTIIEASELAAEQFYESVTDHTWEVFNELLQGFDDLYRASKSVHSELKDNLHLHPESLAIWQVFIEQMADKFQAVNQLMDDEEYIHAGDLIKYELTALFRNLLNDLGEEKAAMDLRFSINLIYLERNFPIVFDVIKDLKRDHYRYQIKNAKNGYPNLSIYKKNNKYMNYYSTFDPEHESMRWTESLEENLNGKTNVFVYGCGFGYHLVQLARKNADYKLVVFEPDEQIFLAAMSVIDLQQLITAANIVDLVVGWDRKRTEKMFYNFLYRSKGETAVVAIPVYTKMDQQTQIAFSENLVTTLHSYRLSMQGHRHAGRKWAKNIMFNNAVNLNSSPIIGLKDKLKGIPVIIVGAGPSLEPDIEVLRKFKDHALIIAAGTAIQSLKHYGIEPHLIVSADGSDAQFEVFKRTDNPSIPLLYVPQIEYRITENRPNVFHVLLDIDLITRYLVGMTEEDIVFLSTHSVTGIAIQAAAFMGCEEIIFTGQDLSYPSENMYSPGAQHITKEENDKTLKELDMLVDNVSGSKNRTNDLMRVTLADIEDMVAKYPHIHFVNSSRLGAVIKNADWSPLESEFERLKEVSVSSTIMLDKMDKHLYPYSDTRSNEMLSRLNDMPNQLKDMEDSLKKMTKKLAELPKLSRTNPNKCMKIMEDIEDVWGTVVDGIPFLTLMATVVRIEIRVLDRDLPELVKETNVIKKAELFGKVLSPMIDAMKDSLPALNELVEEAIQRANAVTISKV